MAAAQVAARAGAADVQLAIMLEDLGLHDRALAFLQGLPAPAADAALRQYGRLLLAARPAATVAAALRHCARDRGGESL